MVWKRFTRMQMKEKGRSLKYLSLGRTFITEKYKTMELKIISAKRLQRQRRLFIYRHGFLILLIATKPQHTSNFVEEVKYARQSVCLSRPQTNQVNGGASQIEYSYLN
jgi:hypothetical protein